MAEEGKAFKIAKLIVIPAFIATITSLVLAYFNYKYQKNNADRTARFQMLAIIYESGNCPEASSVCPPKAARPVREEAIRSYVELRRDEGGRANLRQAFLSLMVFSKKDDLHGSDFSGGTLQGTNFEEEAKLSGSLFVGADLTRVVMNKADLHGANFSDANLQGASLVGANLAGSRLIRASLGVCSEQQFDSGPGYSYKTADLRGANLKGAFLEDVHLCGVNLRGADLSEAKNLSQEALNSAEGDGKTILPVYLQRPSNWDHG
jgi:uncharacterized protein YjbI with pentapeptide repeats